MTTPTPAFRCADASRERADPAVGSAPYAQSWLLIEHRGPWRVDALGGSGIAADVQEQLVAAVLAAGARVLLIRRTGRATRPAVPAWAVVTAAGAIWGQWATDGDLRGAVRTLRQPPVEAAVDDRPLMLVCTHGVHDQCCALRGRPVAAALAAEWPDAVWECSHVGGDRFAPNVVLLPDGVYYGNLDAEVAVPAVKEHLAGRVPLDYLRGMARYRPPVQAAVAAVHQAYGPLGAADVEVLSTETTAAGRWQVRAGVPARGVAAVAVDVHAIRRPPAQLTCRALRETPATEYRAALLS